MSDQEQARERAARELARRLTPVSTLADPYAFAVKFIRDLTASGAWRYIPPAPAITPTEKNPAAYERGAPLAREALQRRMDHHDD